MWYGCGEGLILLVKHLFTRNDKYFSNPELLVKKKLTTKETPRIYQVVQTRENLGLIPVDFKEMLEEI